MKFTEAQLEEAIIELLGEQGYPHVLGENITRGPEEALIKDDLRTYLQARYAADGITDGEIEFIIKKIERLPASDLYGSNKAFMKLVSDGFLPKREDRSDKDLFIHLIDYSPNDQNIYKMVNQLQFRDPRSGFRTVFFTSTACWWCSSSRARSGKGDHP